MKTAYTIHELVLGDERVSPNSVVELDPKVFAELDALGAVRDATDDEAAIAGLAAPKAPAATKPAQAAKKTAAEKKAEKQGAEAPKQGAEAPKQDADPDVTDADLLGGN